RDRDRMRLLQFVAPTPTLPRLRGRELRPATRSRETLPRKRGREDRRASAGRVGALAPRYLSCLALMAVTLFVPCPALAVEAPHCARGDLVLWGDGVHDDTAALNAWLRGDSLVWAATGEPVGEAIADRIFRLSSAIYVPGGTGRQLKRFRLVWPERGETVTGGSVQSGDDPNEAPVVTGVEIVGGDPGEGMPLETPDITRIDRSNPARCAVS